MQVSDFSYWELKHWFTNVDYTIVGSGIVGLNCALELRKKYPSSSILILEKGLLPQGASTKNAGFACFGSVSELLEDLKNGSEQEVIDVLKMRINGLNRLRKLMGDKNIDYQEFGGYELFLEDDQSFDYCAENITYLNNLLKEFLPSSAYHVTNNTFGFTGIRPQLIYNVFEGQIDTGLMMANLLNKAYSCGIKILNNTTMIDFEDLNESVELKIDGFTIKTSKLFIAANGFASKIIDENVIPARAQVLITEPIPNLPIKGTFHMEKGYYYFRNIDDRILFGGARNLDFKAEKTSQFGLTDKIQTRLEELLHTIILPDTTLKIDHRWSGIMGVGDKKYPILKQLSENVYCGVRLSGMGIAIGSTIGKSLADLIEL